MTCRETDLYREVRGNRNGARLLTTQYDGDATRTPGVLCTLILTNTYCLSNAVIECPCHVILGREYQNHYEIQASQLKTVDRRQAVNVCMDQSRV